MFSRIPQGYMLVRGETTDRFDENWLDMATTYNAEPRE
jgi:hypothetical protein